MRCGVLRDVAPKGEAVLTLGPDQQHRYGAVGVDIMFSGLYLACAGT
jgi:hypothetical protein